MRLNLFINLFILFFGSHLNAQKSFIRGTVFDANSGEFLPGVTVVVEEDLSIGTITDLDGKFSLNISPGSYNLRISFVSYETIIISDVQVKENEVTSLDDIGLREATLSLSETVITAEAVRNTETAMLTMKRKSANLVDGVSAASFKKIGDSDAASSMKRVTGVSVEGGKYIFVRGLGDRYTKTILNGLDIPGLDPDRNSLQMDIFPTNVIDNIVVHKSFSATLPADFTGGIVDITLKDFPEEKKGSISTGVGYNPNFHFNDKYLTYEGGKTDFLGFDDGTRQIPITKNVPEYVYAIGNTQIAKEYQDVLNKFNPIMGSNNQTSFMDYNFSASIGNQVAKEKVTLGYNLAFSYKNTTEFFENAEDGKYVQQDDSSIYELEVHNHQIGNYGINSAFLSGLGGFAIKTSYSKYKFNILHLQNGESSAGVFNYENSRDGTNFNAIQHTLDYSQRSLTNLLVDGDHTFKNSKWDVDWKIAPTYSFLYDPDVRFTRYEIKDDGSVKIGTEVGFPERIWRKLVEFNIAGLTHVTREFIFNNQKAKLQFGGAYTFKEREYSIRKFILNTRGNLPLKGDPNELLSNELKWSYTGDISKGTTFENDINKSNEYNSNVNYAAGYISTELPILHNLKSILGIRLEQYSHKYTGQNQQGTKVLDNDKVLDKLDVFPSVNIMYSLDKKQNLRFSYSKTIARPSIKELSYAEIYDPISGRTFIGGLHEDIDNNGTPLETSDDIIFWNGKLTSSDIHNVDLRWELFGSKNQMVSVSGFYKKFFNPIEIVQYFTQKGSYQPRNVGDGEVLGTETEFRFNFGSFTSVLENINISSNVTITKSRIELSNTELEAKKNAMRVGESIDKYRDMAGQAPYIINSGISYDGGKKGFLKGFEAGLFYNVQGKTLQYVGVGVFPNIYSRPFHSLNFNSSKKIGKDGRFQLGVKIENILDNKKEFVYSAFKAEDQVFSSRYAGRKFSVKLSYSFF